MSTPLVNSSFNGNEAMRASDNSGRTQVAIILSSTIVAASIELGKGFTAPFFCSNVLLSILVISPSTPIIMSKSLYGNI